MTNPTIWWCLCCLLRIDRLQLPLFPEGHPWSIWGGRFHPASSGSSGGGLALHQGRCTEWHTAQHCLDSDARKKNKKERVEERKRWRRARKPVEERLLNLGSLALQITVPCSQQLKYWETAWAKSVWDGTGAQRGQASQPKLEGKFKHSFQGGMLWGSQERKNCTWTGKKVQDLSLDFLKGSVSVIISCWGPLHGQYEEDETNSSCNLSLWTNCDVSFQESVLW